MGARFTVRQPCGLEALEPQWIQKIFKVSWRGGKKKAEGMEKKLLRPDRPPPAEKISNETIIES